jgi:uncharacterized damage-inducible protein DinB
MTAEPLPRLFAFDDWANREVLRALLSETTPPAAARRLFAHIVATEWLWLQRFRSEPSSEVWPSTPLEAIGAELDRLQSTWQEVLAGEAATLQRNVAYVNSKGERWVSTASEILQHLILHGVHHRAQIATEFRHAGLEPPYVDFIHAARQRFI